MELKRAVIMGATGAIGMALTEYLLEKQWEVILLVRSSSSKIQSLKEYEEEKRKEGQALIWHGKEHSETAAMIWICRLGIFSIH